MVHALIAACGLITPTGGPNGSAGGDSDPAALSAGKAPGQASGRAAGNAAVDAECDAACGGVAGGGPTGACDGASGVRESAELVRYAPATDSELIQFHSRSYVAALAAPERLTAEQLSSFGLSHDCRPFPGVAEYARLVAGGALAAADALSKGQC